jgi:hypothetical protein
MNLHSYKLSQPISSNVVPLLKVYILIIRVMSWIMCYAVLNMVMNLQVP